MPTLHDTYPDLIERALLLGSSPLTEAFADKELSDVLAANAWGTVTAELTEVAITALGHRQVGDLVPGLQVWSEVEIEAPAVLDVIPPLSTRTKNCLRASGRPTWGEVAKTPVEKILGLRGFGLRSGRELLGACLRLGGAHEFNTRTALAANSTLVGEFLRERHRTAPAFRGVPDVANPDTANLLEGLAMLASWAASELGVRRIAEIIQLQVDPKLLPTDLTELWHEIAETSAESVANPSYLNPDLDRDLGDLLALFDARQQKILRERTLALDPRTLGEIALDLDITRERVRQVEAKAERRLTGLLALPRFRVLLWRASALASSLGCMCPIDHEATGMALEAAARGVGVGLKSWLQGLVLFLAGKYALRDGWLVVGEGPLPDGRALEELADEHGLLPVARANDWLAEKGVASSFHEAWLHHWGRYRRFDDALAVWSGSVVDKCVALLALHGQPADADDLVEEVGEGHNPNGARGRFYEDERLMRVGPSLWALREWGLEEYSSITQEISERVRQGGGRARLADVIEALVTTFGVKDTSVRVYAEAPMFVLEDGWIRHRDEGETFSVDAKISDIRGVYRSASSVISVTVPVDEEVLRGSGRPLPPAVAAILGVMPNQPRGFGSPVGELRVTWPVTAALGPTLGATRSLAQSVHAEQGDSIRLDFNIEDSTVRVTRICALDLIKLDRPDALSLLTGIEDCSANPLEALSQALNVAVGSVRQALSNRDDVSILGLLPTSEMDAGLEDALQDLLGALHRP